MKGEFGLYYMTTRHVGSQPDGDSLWFKPDDPSLLVELHMGKSVKLNKGGFVTLRFERIDALELFYRGVRQSKEMAVAARDLALKEAGFESVIFSPGQYTTVRKAIPSPTKRIECDFSVARKSIEEG